MNDIEEARKRMAEKFAVEGTERLKGRLSQIVHHAIGLRAGTDGKADIMEVVVDLMMTMISVTDVCGVSRPDIVRAFTDYANELPILPSAAEVFRNGELNE